MPAANNSALIGLLQESSLALRSAYLMESVWERRALIKGGKTPDFTSYLAMFGMLKGGTYDTATEIHLETDEWMPNMTFGAIAAPGPGAAVTITITGPYDAQGNSAVETGVSWLLPNNVRGFSTAVNKATPGAHTMTLDPINIDFPAYPAGSTITVLAPSVAQNATSNPQYLTTGVSAYDHPFQKMRWSTQIYDFALKEGKAWVMSMPMETPWNSGKADSWTARELDMLWEKMNWQITSATLFNSRRRMAPRTAGQQSQMDGLVDVVQAQGNNFITPAAFTLPNFKNYAVAFSDRRTGAKRRKVIGGREYLFKVDELMYTLTQQGNHEQEGTMMEHDWMKILNVAGFTFEFANAEIFDDPQGMKAHGYDNKALFIPPAEELVDDYTDGSKHPKFSLKYFSGGQAGIRGATTGTPFTFGQLVGPSFTGGGLQQTQDADNYTGTVIADMMTDIRNTQAFGFSQ